ncbi:NADH-quinone oxidoreductase subunit B family protein [Sulfurovum mangrovi]|uniref:NADH-quinone oxidoreductase subunit B family protein n=1 Tax=Sulfurovum mangrovi TaxID=2893889 RepID=UPI001E5C296A|nr:hydrogenase [Sulfurovum mangrovi]UFH59615.1 hydrogenase [Sulfurovum mangrovi]UFH60756.1 hydrogenase [Sulfurovum mangrovi]
MRCQNKPKLLWLQSITCNGNTHSFLNHPDLFFILSHFEVVHHPVLDSSYSMEDVIAGIVPCDILILEGSFQKEGFLKSGVEVSSIIKHYANKAQHIISVGTCATFGGIFKQKNPETISGFCFNAEEKTERYSTYASKLISLPGCPIHPKWLSYVLLMISGKNKVPIDNLHRPVELYGYTVHMGCTRNEYFEWKIDTKTFGLKEGCLFYETGCRGPYTRGSCNKILWNDINSKTRAGTPCFGCTEPNYPQESLFKTKTNMGIPDKIPLGVSKRAYLTLTGVAKSFTIKRFTERLMEYD